MESKASYVIADLLQEAVGYIYKATKADNAVGELIKLNEAMSSLDDAKRKLAARIKVLEN